jgi:hypothetical protein
MTHPKLDARGNFEVITAERQRAEPGKVIVTALAGLFFLICTWTSYARWANFQYRSFDLAYYVQAIWQLIHGRLDVSVENVPLLGNHVEPIVFLFAPLFAVFRHPMLFVIVQNAALATMPLVGYNIAKRLGLMENVTVYCAPPSCSRRPRATSPFMSSAARSSGRALPSVNASGVGGEVDQSPLALVCRCFGLQRKHGTIAGRLLCNTMRCRTQSRLSRIASLVSLADGPGSDLVPVVRLRNHAGAEFR